ncbi:MAG: ribonuclease HI [Clostridia bacterium]|nr:ribonuclease HI [Clostridia bacterium]
MKHVQIYTDGACSYNPGPGGWGAILIYNGVEKRISGGEPNTTNNRMELLAVINGLSCLKEQCEVELFSDSAYVVNAYLQKWVDNWKANGWKKQKSEIKNLELWKQLDSLVNFHNVKFIKVKGHSDNVYNNECDKMARQQVEKILGGKNE